MLQLDGVSAGYGPVEALRDVSLEVADGALVCVLGANGAGKSSTLKTVSGLLRPQRGRVLFNGRDITRLSPDARVALGIAHCPEGRRVFSRLSVEQNLRVGGHRLPAREVTAGIDQSLAVFPALSALLTQRAGNLSGGEQQMLAIARALMSKPRLLLLDEPSLGLAPAMIAQVFATIAAVSAAGTSVLLVEQNVTKALSAASFGYVLAGGRVEIAAPASELVGSERLRAAYLG